MDNIDININFNDKYIKILEDYNIVFKKAKLKDLEEILLMYKERIDWFKENKIVQWKNYLKHHSKEEFKNIIKSKEYYILIRENNIIAGFQLSLNSKYWNDKTRSLYIYKLVTKINYKGIGNIVISICKEIVNINNKEYLRLDCLSSNKRLNKIYENYDFKLVSTGHEHNYSYSLREYKIK